MDTGIADAINRRDAQLMARFLDRIDLSWPGAKPWYQAGFADTLVTGATADAAWLFGYLAARVDGLHFDGEPAGCDWDSLLSSFRAEIEARRDPLAHSLRAAEIPVVDGVGSR
jgi:hypothetical protein